MGGPTVSNITFVINLEFSGMDQPRQRFRVSSDMKVRRFYYLIASEILRCEDRFIRVFVDGECLLHLGSVTDRHFPGDPSKMTVFLYRDCTAYVHKVGDTEMDNTARDGASESDLPRRKSTRVPGRSVAPVAKTQARPVRDRWFYVDDPPAVAISNDDAEGVRTLMVAQGSSDIFDGVSSGDSSPPTTKRFRVGEETKRYRPDEETTAVIKVSRRERATLLQEFRRGQRLARKQYKSGIRSLWDAELSEDKVNNPDVTEEEVDSEVEAEAYEDYLFTKMMRYDGDSAFQLVEFRNSLRIMPENLGGPNPELIRARTMALWEGLRRVYFGTIELSPARDPVRASRSPIRIFNERTDALYAQGLPERPHEERHDDDTLHRVPNDELDPTVTLEIADLRREIAELEARARRRRGPNDSGRPHLSFHTDEDDDDPDPIELLYDFATGVSDFPQAVSGAAPAATTRADQASQEEDHLPPDEDMTLKNLYTATDKWGAAIEMQPESARPKLRFDESLICDPANGEDEEKFQVGNFQLGNGESQSSIGKTPGGNSTIAKAIVRDQSEGFIAKAARRVFLTIKTLRRILSSKESIFKYGVFVPRSDNEADASPEHVQWSSGRTLEWMRLQEQGTFERNWDWVSVRKAFPTYQKRDIGHLFFVYDFKFSGEHRVRLVFDGSRQNPETYTDTYAPTGRGESVRLFHIVAVEESWEIAQYDVPQAFLKSAIDCDIFVYPPRNFSEFPNQLLKLRLSLYGAKQSAALWNAMIDKFLRSLGFTPSSMDPCLYRRSYALIILFVDDLRVAATPPILKGIYAALYDEYKITTSDGTRFLGMDTIYDLKQGYLKLHMETYRVNP
jgi:hypothetical protein